MQLASNSKQGTERDINEDCIGIKQLDNDFYLLIVADGMGGLQLGEKAAGIVVDSIIESFNVSNETDLTETSIMEALRLADSNMRNLKSDLKCKTGATVALALVCKSQLLYSWQGNVRIYLYRDNDWFQLTTDHALSTGYGEKRLTRCLKGIGLRNDIPIKRLNLNPEECIMICSDGYYEALDILPDPHDITAPFENMTFKDDASYIFINNS